MAQTAKFDNTAISDTILNERTFGWDTAFPSTFPANGWFIRTDLNEMYQNTGTEGTPVWTQRLDLIVHDHSDSSSGGVLDANLTMVNLGGADFSLLTLAVL